MAASLAWKALTDPESQIRDMTHESRMDMYSQAWAYYRNEMFSKRSGRDWSNYLAIRELYKHTRLMYNPVPAIVDFYVDNIWRPAHNEDFESLVTPLSPKTDEKIVTAIAQLDQWGNWLSDSQKIKRYAAAAGNVLIEGIDDSVRQKVLHKTIWPGYVTEIETNSTGDVLAYTLEYEVWDSIAKIHYRYKKVVTKESFSYFKNDQPFTPDGKTADVEVNPYGFCFAVWIKHTDDGADFGLPACSNLDKVDEANSLGSHLHDHIHKAIESPKVLSTDGEVVPIIGGTLNKQTGAITPSDPRLHWVVLKTKTGASVADLAGSLALADAHPYLKELVASFSDDYPELQAASIIKENTQLSGAALERLLGPAQNRLNGVQAGYNQQLIKLRQMQIAVAGMRSNGGGWVGTDKQKAAFKPFNLNSYSSGNLDFNLVKSVLVQSTEAEVEDVLMKKADRASKLSTLVDSHEQLNIAGYSDEQIEEMDKRAAEPDESGVIPLRDINARLDAANKGEGIITHADQLRIVYPNATDAEIEAKLEAFASGDPVRKAKELEDAQNCAE